MASIELEVTNGGREDYDMAPTVCLQTLFERRQSATTEV